MEAATYELNSVTNGRGNDTYLMFDLKVTEEQMKQRFLEKYGYEATKVFKNGPVYFVGPVRRGQ